jgi:tetratricopeptide (TPR) repeat protein
VTRLPPVYIGPVADETEAPTIEEAAELVQARVDLLGGDHPDTLEAMSTLARAYRDAGDDQSAREQLETVLAVRTRILGPDHLDTTRTEFELGLVLKRLNDLFSACRLQERVLESSDRQYGPDSELSIRAATNLANTLRSMKRYDLELPLRERVVQARRESVGSQHMDFFRALVYLATVSHNLHNRKLALDLNLIVLEGFEQNGVDRRAVLALQFNIVIDLIRLKRAREAAEVFERAYNEATVLLPADDPLRMQAEKQRRSMTFLGKHARKLSDRRQRKREREA